MNPFELTKDPDGGGMTVRVKHDFVVLTREEERRVTERVAGLIDENAKLRDAMYTNAGRHALQHMDEDELRIWATQQSEYIDQLEELVRDMWRFTGAACKKYPRLFDPAATGGQMVQLNALDAIEQRMRELGIEDADA